MGDGAAEAVDKIHSLFVANDSHAIPLHHKDNLIRRWKMMFQYLETIQGNSLTQLSSKEDHPDWFEDISTNAKTKEEYLSKGCQARIRGYLAKARSQLFSAKFDDIVLASKDKPFPKYLNEDSSDNDIKKSHNKRQDRAIHRNKRKPGNL